MRTTQGHSLYLRIICACLLFATLAQGESKYSAESLLKESDRARGAADQTEGISWKAHIHTEDNGNVSNIDYLIKVRGDNALAEALSPPRNKGQISLFNNRSVWFYKPGLKKPVSVSPRQKLSGQAANGDIASTNYARDYIGKIVGEENLDGVQTYKLELKAKVKDVTYDQILYWISKEKRLAIKADFLTVNGAPFKRATFQYDNHLALGGASFPFVSKMSIVDVNNEKNLTTLSYQEPKEEKHSANIFNINNIIR